MAKNFKTNLQCGSCLAAAKPFLDKAIGAEKWTVDLTHEDRLLTVDDEQIDNQVVSTALAEAGFECQTVIS